jgi:hypothetical protein
MKDEQSDDPERSLGNGLSRRGMLKWLGAGLVAGVAATFLPGVVREAEAITSGVGSPPGKQSGAQSVKPTLALGGQRRRGRRRGRRRARRRGLLRR